MYTLKSKHCLLFLVLRQEKVEQLASSVVTGDDLTKACTESDKKLGVACKRD